MNLVFLNQYYPPDEAPTGVMLEAVAGAMAKAGHTVTVLCARGGYAGDSKLADVRAAGMADVGDEAVEEGVRVIRIGATRFGRGSYLGKLADYLSYYVGVAWRILTLEPKPDRVVALTTPPYLSVLARVVSRLRGADHAHWVMDLYPDVLVAHGMIRERGTLHRVLAGLARFGFGGGRSAGVVTLGPDMAERVSRHLAPGLEAHWVPLWGTGEESADGGERKAREEWEREGRALRNDRGWADDELVLMYSGNMGLGHRFGEFLAAAAAYSSDGNSPLAGNGHLKPRFVFFGGGKRRREIEAFIQRHPGAPVELHDYVPRRQLAAHLRSADVHFASLEPSWTGVMLPSKLQGIFAAGRPVIFVGSPDSSTARWIGESKGGWTVAEGDLDAMEEAVSAAFDRSERQRRGVAAAKFGASTFCREENASRLGALFERAVSAPRRN